MEMNRRAFLTTAGVMSTGVLEALGVDLGATAAYAEDAPVERGRVTTTICPYCAVGCGAIVTAAGGRIVNVGGDPDHPINEGALCSKGSAMLQIANNERRLTKVKYRAPGSSQWEEKSWDWAIEKIAQNIKRTRDETFVATDEQGQVVNRTEGVACLGGAALDNEECYTYSKLARALGVVYLEHQARI
jgi:formate dehydrogenase major subunit